jgi:hypothetical protein
LLTPGALALASLTGSGLGPVRTGPVASAGGCPFTAFDFVAIVAPPGKKGPPTYAAGAETVPFNTNGRW